MDLWNSLHFDLSYRRKTSTFAFPLNLFGEVQVQDQCNSCWCCKLGSLASLKNHRQHRWTVDWVGEFPPLSDSQRNWNSFPSTSAGATFNTPISIWTFGTTLTSCTHPVLGSSARKVSAQATKARLELYYLVLLERTNWMTVSLEFNVIPKKLLPFLWLERTPSQYEPLKYSSVRTLQPLNGQLPRITSAWLQLLPWLHSMSSAVTPEEIH